MNILTLNLVLSTVVFWLAARIYVVPNLGRWSPRALLVPILLLHSLRHLGLMFLAPGAVHGAMPAEFAYPAALGDVLAAVLAMAALLTGVPRRLAWIFNIVGSLDLILAITLATLYGAPAFMGAAYWIPAFWVPGLLVTHYLAFLVLGRRPVPATAAA